MTKKEKLINWAREKFENDKGGKILLLKNTIGYTRGPYMHRVLENCTKCVEDLGTLLLLLEKYGDELIGLDYEKPPLEGNIYYDNLEEYNEIVESLKNERININDIGISDYYWKSSEDIKYFEEN